MAPRVALVHDWLVAQRGGENVLLAIADLFPEAPIYTLVHVPGAIHRRLEEHRIETSFVQGLPGAPARFRHYLPLFPRAVEAWDFGGYDLVISTSHCVAKGALTGPHQLHISYVHTPMRYLWDQLPQYLPRVPGASLLRPVLNGAGAPLRRWDVASARRPDVMLTNSSFVRERIARFWGRTAQVLYPPVDVERFIAEPTADPRERQGYLVVGALVPYKRVDVAVRLATERDLPLTIIGDGPERGRLERMAGSSVRFLGLVNDDELRRAYGAARALLFCGAEDFGIVLLEATAAGCPVIALDRGGAIETVVDQVNGIFFHGSTSAALGAAVGRFEARGGPAAYSHREMAAHARRFDAARFRLQLTALLDSHGFALG